MLLLSGDVQPIPGPATRCGRTPKYPCTVCGVGVRSNSKAISCDECGGWTHINRCDVSLVVYNDSVKYVTPLSHICDTCLIGELPNFHNLTIQKDSQTNAELHPTDQLLLQMSLISMNRLRRRVFTFCISMQGAY